MDLKCNPGVDVGLKGSCAPSKLIYMNSYRNSMVQVLEKYMKSHTFSGVWAISCWSHPIKNHDFFWHVAKVGGRGKSRRTTLRDTFISWYNSSGTIKSSTKFAKIDGEWGSNRCHTGKVK